MGRLLACLGMTIGGRLYQLETSSRLLPNSIGEGDIVKVAAGVYSDVHSFRLYPPDVYTQVVFITQSITFRYFWRSLVFIIFSVVIAPPVTFSFGELGQPIEPAGT